MGGEGVLSSKGHFSFHAQAELGVKECPMAAGLRESVMGGMCCEGCVEEVGCYERGVGEGVCFEECPMSALLQAPPPPEGCIRVVLGV